ncbi:proline-rich receptor-like protein kinase PERK9 [Iris pallida]|uniref:Proline-rich receptor-like protein kinase PERK9 n=1 Tax=Iris pallida TaxID=29817 RepID=A0AAX6DX82_IRIPA|nr:proline-rich receptor-like protein kinase PERK9 [Iris pallida]
MWCDRSRGPPRCIRVGPVELDRLSIAREHRHPGTTSSLLCEPPRPGAPRGEPRPSIATGASSTASLPRCLSSVRLEPAKRRQNNHGNPALPATSPSGVTESP